MEAASRSRWDTLFRRIPTLLGIVMGVAAYAIERAVVRGTKRANEEPDAASTKAGG